jgi:hypothetical protein
MEPLVIILVALIERTWVMADAVEYSVTGGECRTGKEMPPSPPDIRLECIQAADEIGTYQHRAIRVVT